MCSTATTRLFRVDYGSGFFNTHYQIATANNVPLLFCETSTYTFGKPDIILHAGSSKYGRTVGSVKIGTFGSFKINITRGNKHETMTDEGIFHFRYRWSMAVPWTSDARMERRQFLWKKTTSTQAVHAHASFIPKSILKLVEEKTNRVIAVFTHKSQVRGKLQINVSYGEGFDNMIFLTLMGLNVARSRRNSAAGGGGGGAGCGGGGGGGC